MGISRRQHRAEAERRLQSIIKARFCVPVYNRAAVGQRRRKWHRDLNLGESFFQLAATKERAEELARLNLPRGTKFLLVKLEQEWLWMYLGPAAEEKVA